jgi:hypothetical protein
MPDLPARIGPVEFEQFGAKWVAVRCPSDFDELMRLTGGLREVGSQRWLIPRWRINSLMRKLQRTTDPLFRPAGEVEWKASRPLARLRAAWRRAVACAPHSPLVTD